MRSPSADLCPVCGHHAVVDVVYGFPSPEMIDDAEQGRIALGGCLVIVDNDGNPLVAQRVCKNCRWQEPDPDADIEG